MFYRSFFLLFFYGISTGLVPVPAADEMRMHIIWKVRHFWKWLPHGMYPIVSAFSYAVYSHLYLLL